MYSGYYPPASSSTTFGAPAAVTSAYHNSQQTLYSPTPSSSSTTGMQSSPSSFSGGYRKPRHSTGSGNSEDDLWKYINDDAAMNATTLIPDFGTIGASKGYPGTTQALGDSLSAKYKKAISGSSLAPSPYSSPASSSNASASPQQQTVTFSTCPKCNTVEHHFFQQSRTCGRCGHTRYFVSACAIENFLIVVVLELTGMTSASIVLFSSSITTRTHVSLILEADAVHHEHLIRSHHRRPRGRGRARPRGARNVGDVPAPFHSKWSLSPYPFRLVKRAHSSFSRIDRHGKLCLPIDDRCHVLPGVQS